ncbi:Wzy polymerase domain-containing protein [Vogesella fluminis]|uniref:PglL family O-oligosaccharyltransferase n=1 Tax=Vogesella fluminis TaxID=1069161 RepID=UPI0036314580
MFWLPLGAIGSGVDRMLAGGFGARRWVEWQKAWQVFQDHPLFGVGLGGYAAQSVRLEVAMGFAGQWSESWLFTHSHNLILQLLAETGLLGTAVVVIGLCWAFLPFFRKEQATAHSLLVVLLAMVLLLHSMVEYPLWYMSFLGLFAVLLGLSPARRYTLAIRPSMRNVLMWGFCALLLWQSVAGLQAYGKLVRWIVPGPNAQLNVMRAEEIWHIARNPLWTYEADMVLANYLIVDKRQLKEKRALFERLTAYRPHAGMLINVAILRALDGDRVAAEQALRFAIAAYPAYTPGFAAELMSRRDPELLPLQAIANAALQASRNGGAASAASSVLAASGAEAPDLTAKAAVRYASAFAETRIDDVCFSCAAKVGRIAAGGGDRAALPVAIPLLAAASVVGKSRPWCSLRWPACACRTAACHCRGWCRGWRCWHCCG